MCYARRVQVERVRYDRSTDNTSFGLAIIRKHVSAYTLDALPKANYALVTVNARQAAHLAKVAQAKKLFLMEAVWTRFFPISKEIQRLIHEEKVLGEIRRVFADLSMVFKRDPNSRLYSPDLAGGALLDLGIYPFTW
jgi:hypothetical protein